MNPMPSGLAQACNVEDIRRLARGKLPKGIYESIERGTEDEVALGNNRDAFNRIKFNPHMLVDVSRISTETELFGEKIAMPLAIAPTGSAGLVWFQGEVELARAAAKCNVPFTLATRSLSSIETIAEEAGGNLWLQLYVWRDRQLSYQLIDRARAAGFKALMVTADTPVPPNREYNLRNGYGLPFKPSRAALVDMALHPAWLLRVMGRYMANGGMPRFETLPGRPKITEGTPASMGTSESVTWDDIRELRRRWKGILMVKGILRVDDAIRAADCGVDAVVLSNHGGRNLDGSRAPIDVLPEVADALGHRLHLLVDSGVRRGSDIVKAMALGASAVLSGRPTLFGTAVAGQAGAAHVLDILRRETVSTLGMVGCPDIRNVDRDLLSDRAGCPGMNPGVATN
jgi:isopentenyl diphosphate isomerase/L-lactate dehydrogenase-like FMN-dependent dehydrogenase